MSVQGEIIRITEAKTDIASAINEQGYTQVDEDASISTYADAIRANTNAIKTELSDYLPLSGGTMSGDITMPGETKLIFGDTSIYNNGNLLIDGALQVESSLSVNYTVTATGFAHATNNSNDYVLLAGGGTKLLSEISPDMSGYLPLSGGTLSGDLIIQRGESALSLSNCELNFNNGGGISCDDPTSVNFYGFDSSLSFDEGGYSNWESPVSKIYSDELTIGGINASDAVIYLGHEQSNVISTTDQDSTLSIRSAEKISLSAGGDSIYLTAPSISLDSYDISASGAIAASGFQVKNSSDDYVLLAGGGTKLLSDIKPDVSGYLPLTGGTLSGNFKVADIFSVSTNNTENNIDIIIGDYSSNKAVRIAYAAPYAEDGEFDIINNPHLIVGPTTSASLHINRCGMQAVSMNTTPAQLYLNPQGGTTNFGGDVMASAFYETSDARKKDIKEDLSLDKCYDLIDKCQTVIYSLKDQTKEQVGMIAQEIEEFFPEVVAADEEGFKSLAYDRLVVICFKVLKDVIKRLEKLEQ